MQFYSSQFVLPKADPVCQSYEALIKDFVGSDIFWEQMPAGHCTHHVFQDYHVLTESLWWIVQHSRVTNFILLLRVAKEQLAFGWQAVQKWAPAIKDVEGHQAVWWMQTQLQGAQQWGERCKCFPEDATR